MKIQIGEVYLDKVTGDKIPYPNKTKKYLLPCLAEYGEEFINHFDSIFKVAVGIGDIIVKNRGLTYEKHVFILVHTQIAPYHFQNFIKWIKDQPMYEDDYVYDNIQKSVFHMIVLKLPEKYYETFHTFKEGKYSQMFDKDSIDKFFNRYPSIRQVFIKKHNYKVHFVEKLRKHLGVDLPIDPVQYTGELEFPLTEKGEIFNHHIKH